MTRREFMASSALVLREDSAARVLERELGDAEYLLLRIADSSVIAQRWIAPNVPAPLASLAKPLAAIEYARTHSRFPRHNCTRGDCWLPSGHGLIGIEQAIAQSCNAYFANLPARVPDAAAPLDIALAYAELAQTRSDRTVSAAYTGMRLAARAGTAAPARARIAAKTGTARCAHSPRSAGDGLLIAIFPEDTPEHVLLVRRCGNPGSVTAKACAPVFRSLGLSR